MSATDVANQVTSHVNVEDLIEVHSDEATEETLRDSHVNFTDRRTLLGDPCLGSRAARKTRVGGVSW